MKKVLGYISTVVFLLLGITQMSRANNPEVEGAMPACPTSTCSGATENNSVNLAISCGPLAPGSFLNDVRLALEEHTPSAMTATPQALKLDAGGYVMTSISGNKVGILKGSNTPMMFEFASGSSIGYPTGVNAGAPEYLTKVGAVSAPTYYNLSTGDGSYLQFFATTDTSSDNYLDLHGVCIKSGFQTLDDMGLKVIRDSSQVLRQVKTPSRLLDIVSDISDGYSVKIYNAVDVSYNENDGEYDIGENATLIEKWEIQNPNTNEITIKNYIGTSTTAKTTTQYIYLESNDEWKMTKDGGDTWNRYYHLPDSDVHTQTYVREITKNGQINYKKVTVQAIDKTWGTPVLSETEYLNATNSITTTYTYYENSSDNGYKKKRSMKRTDGYWEYYEYDSDGRMNLKVTPWLDLDWNPASTTPPSGGKRTIYYYTAHDSRDTVLPTDTRPRTVIEQIGENTNEVSRIYYAYYNSNDLLYEEKHEYTYINNYLDNLVTYTIYGSDGRLIDIWYPDGHVDNFSRQYGTYVTAQDINIPTATYETTTHLGIGDLISGQSTQEIQVYDASGYLVLEETEVYNGSDWENIGWTRYEYNASYPGRVDHVYYSDGTQEEYNWGSNCCGLESETDRYGNTTTYTYDDYGRISSKTVPVCLSVSATGTPTLQNVLVEYTYDGKGRTLSTTRTSNSGAGSLSLSSSKTYDWKGRVLTSTDEQGLTTTTSYNDAARTVTTTYPSSTGEPRTRVVTKYRDGQIESVTGTAVIEEHYTYGYGTGDDEGLQWTIKNIGHDDGNGAYPRWEKTTTDMLGRVVSVEVPGYGSGVTIQETRAYDADTGKLVSTTRSVSPQDASISDAVTYYEYDEMGNIYRSGVDINEDEGLSLASTDRISETIREYVKESGIWYAKTESATYPINGSYTRLVLSTQRVQLTGLGGSSGALGVLTGKSIQKDEYGNATTTWTYVNRSAKKVTEKTLPPGYGAANHITTTINGFVMSASTTATGALATYKYDGLGRQTHGVDPRIPDQSGCNLTHYNALGQVDYTKDGAGKQTSYAYDADTGELISVTDPVNKAIHYVYDQRGQKVGEYGATYPVIYCYNGYGEMTNMFTCRTSYGASGLVNTSSEFNTLWNDVLSDNYAYVDQTQWIYDPATGLLTGKRDDAGNGPDYTYYKDGELKTREWARSVGTRVKSTYTYDALTRELQSVEYNDGTPNVTYGTRDRLGNVASITDAQGTRTFTYTNKGALDTETISPTGGNTIKIERERETSTWYVIGRILGFNLDINNTRTQTIDYHYDNYNRLQRIMFEEYNGDTDLVEYSYLPNSDFVEYGMFMTAHDYRPAIMSKRTYETNRDLVHSVENSIIADWDATPVVINSFTQTYDDAGKLANRTNVRFQNWMFSTANDQFSYNEHNEISMGSLSGSTTYYTYDNIGNRTGSSITPNAVNQYVNYGSSFVNQYDNDGNLTADGTWRYKWNAENQLIQMWTYHSSDSPQYNDKKIVFTYDYMGRRVKKMSYVYNNGSWHGVMTNDFVYDGWNMIYEKVEKVNTQYSYGKHYVWGLDLSGSLQGAGGVGGLAAVFINGTYNPSIPLYDANGNITAYTELSGLVRAQFYYDAFGNVTERTDGYQQSPDLFNFRFSTKYQDLETDLNYYGHRYYKPSWGRWLNPDPIEEQGGLNLYGFVGNDAMGYIDIRGLQGVGSYNIMNAGIAVRNMQIEQQAFDRIIKQISNKIRSNKDRRSAEAAARDKKDGCASINNGQGRFNIWNTRWVWSNPTGGTLEWSAGEDSWTISREKLMSTKNKHASGLIGATIAYEVTAPLLNIKNPFGYLGSMTESTMISGTVYDAINKVAREPFVDQMWKLKIYYECERCECTSKKFLIFGEAKHEWVKQEEKSYIAMGGLFSDLYSVDELLDPQTYVDAIITLYRTNPCK